MTKLSHNDIYRGPYAHLYEGFSAVFRHADHLFEYLVNRQFMNDSSTCLSIGSGKGILELMLMEKYSNLKMYLVEPSERYSREFGREARSRNLSSRVMGVSTNRFQAFDLDERFDRILSIHSWYGFGNNHELLQKAMGFLNPEGALFITAVDEANAAWVEKSGIRKYEWHTGNFSQWLKETGIDHTVDTELRRIPISSMFDGDQFTEEGKGVVAFHALVPFEEVSSETKVNFRKAVFDAAIDGDDGQPSVQFSFGCITIPAQS